jgi:hypothetical protein
MSHDSSASDPQDHSAPGQNDTENQEEVVAKVLRSPQFRVFLNTIPSGTQSETVAQLSALLSSAVKPAGTPNVQPSPFGQVPETLSDSLDPVRGDGAFETRVRTASKASRQGVRSLPERMDRGGEINRPYAREGMGYAPIPEPSATPGPNSGPAFLAQVSRRERELQVEANEEIYRIACSWMPGSAHQSHDERAVMAVQDRVMDIARGDFTPRPGLAIVGRWPGLPAALSHLAGRPVAMREEQSRWLVDSRARVVYYFPNMAPMIV